MTSSTLLVSFLWDNIDFSWLRVFCSLLFWCVLIWFDPVVFFLFLFSARIMNGSLLSLVLLRRVKRRRNLKPQFAGIRAWHVNNPSQLRQICRRRVLPVINCIKRWLFASLRSSVTITVHCPLEYCPSPPVNLQSWDAELGSLQSSSRFSLLRNKCFLERIRQEWHY